MFLGDIVFPGNVWEVLFVFELINPLHISLIYLFLMCAFSKIRIRELEIELDLWSLGIIERFFWLFLYEISSKREFQKEKIGFSLPVENRQQCSGVWHRFCFKPEVEYLWFRAYHWENHFLYSSPIYSYVTSLAKYSSSACLTSSPHQ